MLNTYTTYTASEARDNLYDLVRSAGKGLRSYEITLRGAKPVILMSREELDNWMETFDVMSNPEEVRAIKTGKKSKKSIPLEKLLKEPDLSK